MYEPRIYVRCDALTISDEKIRTNEDIVSIDYLECVFDIVPKFTIETDHADISLTIVSSFKDNNTTQFSLEKTYTFSYSLEKYYAFSKDEIVISAINEMNYDLVNYFGVIFSLYMQSKCKVSTKEMS